MSGPAFSFRGETLTLVPERALWWEREGVLMVADLHLGKPASLRACGVPVPDGTDTEDLQRLSSLLERTQASKLLILGDLIHDRNSLTDGVIATFRAWRLRHSGVEVLLALGNHDRHVPGHRETLGLDACAASYELGPFVFQHRPETRTGRYVVAGHIHPRVRLSAPGRRGSRLSMPCFLFKETVGILPAFGSFTGSYRMSPAPEDRVIVVADGSLMEVPPALWS